MTTSTPGSRRPAASSRPSRITWRTSSSSPAPRSPTSVARRRRRSSRARRATTTTTTSTTTTTLPGFTGTLNVRRARMTLPDGAQNDRFTMTGFFSLGPGSDGIDPTHDGFSLVLTGLRFDVPASGFTGTPGRWRYRDRTGAGSNPDGLTSISVQVRRDGSYRVSVSGRNMDLSTFDGTTDRSA